MRRRNTVAGAYTPSSSRLYSPTEKGYQVSNKAILHMVRIFVRFFGWLLV